MRMITRIFISSVLLLSTVLISQVYAEALSLNMSEHTVHAAYISESNSKGFDASFLHREDEGELYNVSLFVSHDQDNIKANLGGKLFLLDHKNINGHGIALGGSATYKLSSAIKTQASAYYAPSVTSYRDIEKYSELDARFILTLFKDAEIYAGYRDIYVNIDTKSGIDVHNGGYFGLKLAF